MHFDHDLWSGLCKCFECALALLVITFLSGLLHSEENSGKQKKVQNLLEIWDNLDVPVRSQFSKLLGVLYLVATSFRLGSSGHSVTVELHQF